MKIQTIITGLIFFVIIGFIIFSSLTPQAQTQGPQDLIEIHMNKLLEQKCAKDFRDIGWLDCMTTREARGGNWSESDMGIDLAKTHPFSVQCKRGAKFAPIMALEEIKILKEDNIPLLLTKRDRGPVMAILSWENLQMLIRQSFPS